MFHDVPIIEVVQLDGAPNLTATTTTTATATPRIEMDLPGILLEVDDHAAPWHCLEPGILARLPPSLSVRCGFPIHVVTRLDHSEWSGFKKERLRSSRIHDPSRECVP